MLNPTLLFVKAADRGEKGRGAFVWSSGELAKWIVLLFIVFFSLHPPKKGELQKMTILAVKLPRGVGFRVFTRGHAAGFSDGGMFVRQDAAADCQENVL